jgi:antitoxin component YwqK of YwqJK toxin-antitoxin module
MNGKLEGEYMAFHKTGEKSLKTKYKAGKLHGRYETWNAFNKRQFNKEFKLGVEVVKKPGGSSAH